MCVGVCVGTCNCLLAVLHVFWLDLFMYKFYKLIQWCKEKCRIKIFMLKIFTLTCQICMYSSMYNLLCIGNKVPARLTILFEKKQMSSWPCTILETVNWTMCSKISKAKKVYNSKTESMHYVFWCYIYRKRFSTECFCFT